MARLLILVVHYLLSSVVKRLMLGAGLAFGSYTFINSLFEKYIDLAIKSDANFTSAFWGIAALAGLPTCISLLLSATVVRIIIQTTQLSLKKL